MRRTGWFIFLAPRNLCVAVLKVYRMVISPIYGDVCRYYPSCSHYAMQAFQHHGVVRGVYLSATRVARCHPWAAGGVDDIPADRNGYVLINRFGFAIPGTSSEAATCLMAATSLTTSQGKG